MRKNMRIKKIFRSKILILSLIYSFLLLITTEATPNKVESDSSKEFKPVVRVKEAQERVPASQKDRFERLIEEGKKLFQEEMDYEGAIKKFKEAKNLAVTKAQKADVFFYLSLAYYTTLEDMGIEEFVEAIRKLIEIDYDRELDNRLCPPRYVELFEGIKKEYGVLIVQSKPAGADVYLDGSNVSAGKTPLTIGSKAGSVKIVLKKGKKVKRQIISVVAGKEVTTPIYILKGGSSLLLVLGGLALAGGAGAALLLKSKSGEGGNGEPGPTTGSIQVNSTPEGARIYLDGNNTGQTTNSTLTNLIPRSYTIELIKEGYVDYQEIVSVTAGQTTTVNAPLTQHTITVTSPTSGTIWTQGDEVEIRWETNGSASFKAHASPTTELNSLSYPGRNLSPSFQRRAFRHNPAFRGLLRTRRGLESSNSAKNEGTILDKSSKFQDVSKKLSSHAEENNIVHSRAKNRNFSNTNLPFSPGTSFISSKHLPQASEPSGNIKALTLTDVKIELYKGTSLVQTIASGTENVGSYTWIVDSSLEDGSDYKVKISCASALEVYGESDAFSIEGRSITVTEPTSSTVWTKGYSADTTWTSNGTIGNVKIDLYKGGTLNQTIVSSTANDGSYTWTEVDTSLADGTDYKVMVSSTDDSTVYGESDEFRIVEKSITVTEPTSSTVWARGFPADIAWTSTGTIGDVKIDLYKGGTLNQTIVSSTANDGSYTWAEVDTSLADGTDYKVRVSSIDDSSVYGESEEFLIEEISITVTEPTSSSVWTRGYSADITWTSSGTISDVKIDLYKGGTFNQTIISSTTNDGSYTWTEVDTSLTDGTDYKIRVLSTSDSSVYGESDEFQITSVSICEPVDNCDLAWSTGGDADWFGQTDFSYYDGDAAQSGAISHNQLSYVQTTVTGGGILKFYWRVSSESNYDYLTFYVDDVPVPGYQISGEVDWQQKTYTIGEGSHSIKWEYEKDSTVSDGSDCGWLDKVEFIMSPIIITSPTSSTVWAKGHSADIAWTSTGTISDVKIDLYKGGTLNLTIVSSTTNNGSYTWSTVDSSLADGADYKVRISSTSDSSVYGESDEFRIESVHEGFDSQFNVDANGWEVHSGLWWIADNAWYTTEGLPEKLSSVSYAANFRNFEYEVKLKRYNPSGYDRSNRLYIHGTPNPLGSEDSWYTGYMFQYMTDGRYSVWKEVAGVSTPVQYWASSAAINTGDAWNTLKVVANGSNFNFYINGTLVWSGSDSSLSSGRVGIAMFRDGASTGDQLWVDWATLTPTSGTAGTFGIAGTVSAEQKALNDEANNRRDKNKDMNGKPKR